MQQSTPAIAHQIQHFIVIPPLSSSSHNAQHDRSIPPGTMSKDGKTKTKDKSKRRESKSGSEPKKSRKSSSSSSTLPLTVVEDGAASASSTASGSRTVTSAFETMYPVLNLPIPPVWSNDPYAAFSDLMDTLVMRHVPQLSGVLITHSPTRFLQDTALFSADSAFATAAVGFECVVWRPKIGQMLEGTICLSSPSHVSLLLYGLFNASIPASHLPEEDWEFVLNDAEAGSNDHGLGYWQSKSDGSRLGGQKGTLAFTVISLTVANHMLSLHGSLLPDPFKGPPPTLDRSYLKKSLLPNQLGLATPSARPTTQTAESPAPTPPRRVRWQDQDNSDTDQDQPDLTALETPQSVKAEPPSIDSSAKPASEKHKRKSSSTKSPPDVREKKRRKEA